MNSSPNTENPSNTAPNSDKSVWSRSWDKIKPILIRVIHGRTFVKNFLVVFGVLWLLSEPVIGLQLITADATNNYKYYELLVGLSLGISFLQTILEKRIKDYLYLGRSWIDTLYKTGQIRNNVLRMISESSYFKLILVDTTIDASTERVRNILGNNTSFKVRDRDVTVVHIFNNILKRLGKNDRYVTVSNLNFWYTVYRSNSDFLQVNISAARDRRVAIGRVILIRKDELRNPLDLMRIKEMVTSLEAKERENVKEFELLGLKFHVYDNDLYSKEKGFNIPFAIMTSDDYVQEQIAIMPSYSKDIITELNVTFNHKQTKQEFDTHIALYTTLSAYTKEKGTYSLHQFRTEVLDKHIKASARLHKPGNAKPDPSI